MMNWRVLELRRFIRKYNENVINFNPYAVVNELTDIGILVGFEFKSEYPNFKLIERYNELSLKYARLLETRVK